MRIVNYTRIPTSKFERMVALATNNPEVLRRIDSLIIRYGEFPNAPRGRAYLHRSGDTIRLWIPTEGEYLPETFMSPSGGLTRSGGYLSFMSAGRESEIFYMLTHEFAHIEQTLKGNRKIYATEETQLTGKPTYAKSKIERDAELKTQYQYQKIRSKKYPEEAYSQLFSMVASPAKRKRFNIDW
jgi:hypothetical protein